MKRITTLTFPALAAGALAGCVGGSGGGTVGGGTASSVYSDTSGTASQALLADETLATQRGLSAAQNLDYNTGDTALTQADVQVLRNANGELSLVVNGVQQDFTTAQREVDPNDGQIYGYTTAGANNVWSGMWNYKGTLDDALDPNNPDYLQIWGYQTNQVNPNGPDVKGFAVIGTETRASDLAGMPTATYSGRARLDTVPDTGFVDNATSNTRTRADLDMTANFGAGTIAGTLSNITVQDPGQAQVGVAGTIAMDQTAIKGNGFKGTLTADPTFTASMGAGWDASGSYSGMFYGPAANQVGGTLSVTGTNASGGFNGVGYFYGDQD